MIISAEQRESIENIVCGAMLPVATGGFAAIDVHGPGAADAIVRLLERGDS